MIPTYKTKAWLKATRPVQYMRSRREKVPPFQRRGPTPAQRCLWAPCRQTLRSLWRVALVHPSLEVGRRCAARCAAQWGSPFGWSGPGGGVRPRDLARNLRNWPSGVGPCRQQQTLRTLGKGCSAGKATCGKKTLMSKCQHTQLSLAGVLLLSYSY